LSEKTTFDAKKVSKQLSEDRKKGLAKRTKAQDEILESLKTDKAKLRGSGSVVKLDSLKKDRETVRGIADKSKSDILASLKKDKEALRNSGNSSATAETLRTDRAKARNAPKDTVKDPAKQKQAQELEAKEAENRTKIYLAGLDVLKFPELAKRAKRFGIKTGDLKKPELISKIVEAESKI